MPRQAENGRVGIKDVATTAGVAISSVSRVLSGHPDVSAEMKARVLEAVEAVGYEPDFLAQSLRRGVTSTVGFLVGDISNPLFSEIAVGAELALQEAGFAMIIANSQGAPEQDAAQLRVLRQRRVDGMIVSLADERNRVAARLLRDMGRPFVLVDREITGAGATSAVLSDHAAGMRAAAAHLIDLGHRRIGFAGGTPTVRPTRARADALVEACAGRRGVRAVVDCGAFTAEHGELATARMLDSATPPTAIIAGGNQLLVGVLRAIRARGLHVPGDISLVTCDTTPLAELLEPPLARITRDARELGRMAATLMLGAMQGNRARRIELPVEFSPGESCAAPGAR
ncbi:MAG TPA: LacI family DNA-binding transcriptional regulator [Acidimicrobiales bacterium]|nr:LacI family DNA-binding transcriptional regulator [Acidimicrobiales bacterium]